MDNYYQSFLIKYAEIGIKGKNRHLFEEALVRQIKFALKKVAGSFSVRRTSGRIYVDAQTDFDYDDTVMALKSVFGIAGICPVVSMADEGFSELSNFVVKFLNDVYHPDAKKPLSFKVAARRSRKDYPLDSMELNAKLGAVILESFPSMRVDVHKPDIMLHVEIREKINLYSEIIPGPGGMPVGTNGKAMLLLSGGIDSPVAGYMIAKRGVKIDAVYFHAPPYTSERAKQKVIDLARIISRYTGPIYLNIINFTDIQLYIYDQCPHEELTIIMRRYMMRIAEQIANQTECLGLITGESIGQVASQTLKSLAATNEATSLPVYRPLIGFDKMEIVSLAGQIGTYETSIQPYEDCCTIFVAKHPVTKPNPKRILRSETRLAERIEGLVENAVSGRELVIVRELEET
ncbi:MAG: tRNA 4-thiouridine(8) synthase ThiI [Lachnospiraceae bacterium]|nr:tRNA 4-thiouridine(8) synthase ThiI [Lachnospiraceae bacterium]